MAWIYEYTKFVCMYATLKRTSDTSFSPSLCPFSILINSMSGYLSVCLSLGLFICLPNLSVVLFFFMGVVTAHCQLVTIRWGHWDRNCFWITSKWTLRILNPHFIILPLVVYALTQIACAICSWGETVQISRNISIFSAFPFHPLFCAWDEGIHYPFESFPIVGAILSTCSVG